MDVRRWLGTWCTAVGLWVATGGGLAATPATVVHWFSGPYAMFDFVKNQVSAFEKANPDLKVELVYVHPDEVYQKYTVMFASNLPVDVIWANSSYNLPYYVSRQLLLPLNGLAAKVGLNFRDFVKPVIDQASWQGQVYGVPYAALPAPGLFFNKDLFDQVGLPYPTGDWRYESDFAGAARKLTVDRNGDGTPDQFGVNPLLTPSRKWSAYAVLSAFGGRVLSTDGRRATVTDEPTLAGLRFLARLANEDRVTGGSYWHGTAAMDLDGYWAIAGFTQTLGSARWGVAAPPRGPAGRKVVFHAGYYAVPRTAANPEGALRWIKHLVSDEVGKAFVAGKFNMTAKMRVNALPELLTDEATRTWVTFYELEGEPPPIPANFRISDVDKAVFDAMERIVRQEAPVEQIALQLQQTLTAVLAQPAQ